MSHCDRYDVREPEDEQWGLEISGGNWTGIVGTLQHEKADFSMDLTLTPQRAAVVEFSRVYIDEDTVILSTKPRPLPEYLSLINPFGGENTLFYVSKSYWRERAMKDLCIY